MPDLAALGPWLRRFLCEHIVTELNLAQNTCKSYRDTFSLLLPFVSRKVRKPRGPAYGIGHHVRMGAAVPRSSRDGSRLLRPDPHSATGGHTHVRALRRQPRSGSCRMVRSHPGYRVEEIDAAAGWMADQGGDGGDAGNARPQDPAGSERVRASALPLQHRCKGVGGRPTEGVRSADRIAERRARSPPCTARAAGRGTARCGRKPSAFWWTRSPVGRAKTPCSSAGSGRRSPASGSIA
mgnify:FL=1